MHSSYFATVLLIKFSMTRPPSNNWCIIQEGQAVHLWKSLLLSQLSDPVGVIWVIFKIWLRPRLEIVSHFWYLYLLLYSFPIIYLLNSNTPHRHWWPEVAGRVARSKGNQPLKWLNSCICEASYSREEQLWEKKKQKSETVESVY